MTKILSIPKVSEELLKKYNYKISRQSIWTWSKTKPDFPFYARYPLVRIDFDEFCRWMGFEDNKDEKKQRE